MFLLLFKGSPDSQCNVIAFRTLKLANVKIQSRTCLEIAIIGKLLF